MTLQNLYLPNQGALSDLAGWIAGDLGPSLARLYTGNVPYLPTRVPADYTEAAWAGYVAQATSPWGVPFINAGGYAETDSPPLTWLYTVGGGTGVAYGVYVTNPAKTKLLLVLPFLSPVIFSPSNTSLTLSLQVSEISQI